MASPISAASGETSLPRRTISGSVEDRYRSLLLIGRGGMGTVEVALERREEGVERVVALKRLLPEASADPRREEMFLREARLAALLVHPNVVHVYAFGELCGELFMAMEYVEGEPLSHVLRVARERNCALEPGLVAFVLAQVCDGLHAAHELRDNGGLGQPLNVVHRDVSPHNVMISYDGQVKLLDFGVAKFESAGHESRTGEVKGKMAYMSPEQALGEKLDRRSDLFSVGAVLFECLSGERMWGDGTDLEVMRRLALEEPPRLDAVMGSAAQGLVDLHRRLVARELEKRPVSAHQVAEELRAFAAATVAQPPTTDAVRALMQELFGTQAAQRRAILTESLEHAAPSRVQELRRQFEADALPHQVTTSTEALIVRSPPSRAQAGRQSSQTIAAASLAALLGAIVASYVLQVRMPSGARADPAMVTVHPTASASAGGFPAATESPSSPNPPAIAPATEMAGTPATTRSTATTGTTLTPSATVTTSAVASPPAIGPSATSNGAPTPAQATAATAIANSPRTVTSAAAPATRPRASVEAPSPGLPVKLPDVDPTPF
jgi:serine/threonine-protein kinase